MQSPLGIFSKAHHEDQRPSLIFYFWMQVDVSLCDSARPRVPDPHRRQPFEASGAGGLPVCIPSSVPPSPPPRAVMTPLTSTPPIRESRFNSHLVASSDEHSPRRTRGLLHFLVRCPCPRTFAHSVVHRGVCLVKPFPH